MTIVIMNLNLTWSNLELNKILYKDDPKFVNVIYLQKNSLIIFKNVI
jgi:hypothetical protein